MRRRLATLTVTVVGLLLVAVPAFAAAEEAEATDDTWTGLIYALIAAVIVGVYAFIDAYATHDRARDGDHH